MTTMSAMAISLQSQDLAQGDPWFLRTRLALWVKRVLNMACCSPESKALLSSMRSQLQATLPPASKEESSQLLDCVNCEGFMAQPVCLACGHSVCKPCMERPLSGIGGVLLCPRCKQRSHRQPAGLTGDRRPTLVLQNAVQKWFPRRLEACRHREEGNTFAKEGDFPLAVQWYTKAVETGISDHRILGNRSRAYLAMERLEDALSDAEACCRLRPHWPKGHFRRAAVLETMGRWREAVAAYLLCLHLGGSDHSVTISLCQILDKQLRALQQQSDGGGCGHPAGPSHQEVTSSVSETIQLCVKSMEYWEREGGGSAEVEVPSSLIDTADFECALCTSLLYNPVTTACGHSFCQTCLCRSFDHSPFCPICRTPLSETFTQHCHTSGQVSVDWTLEDVLLHHFREAYQEKRTQREREAIQRSRIGLSETEELPIFVCTIAYPGMPCPLHVFEPRYRLMIRRCMETESRRFGMCEVAEEEGVPFVSCGTVLHIDSVQYTPDGRSLLTTTGEKRFKVVSRGMADGYHTARIEFIIDQPVITDDEIASLRALQQEVYDHAGQWLNALPIFTRLLIMQSACMPLCSTDPTPECCPNGPMWMWWYIHILPASPQRKMEFLQCTSLRERLLMLRESLPLPTPTS